MPLSEELEQQRLYLEVEAARFGERLHYEIDVADDARSLPVPSLILQPLIENAIKYAVSPSQGQVRIRVRAAVVGENLHIVVEDDGGFAPESVACGTGTGLRNVVDRLKARFGDRAGFKAGPWPGGGFRVDR